YDGRARIVAEELLHLAAVEADSLEIVAGGQPLLDVLAADDVAQLHLDERAQVAGRAVVVLGDDIEVAIKLGAHARAEVGRLHCVDPSCESGARAPPHRSRVRLRVMARGSGAGGGGSMRGGRSS